MTSSPIRVAPDATAATSTSAETTTPAAAGTTTRYLARPGGRVAYDVTGDGPLVVLVPGMGDLRAGFRFLVPALAAAGHRVATTDLRGHGDSDATFSSYGDVETEGDLTALLEVLGGPAVLGGNSMGAGAAALVAADRPELVRGLVLLGPFLRDPASSQLARWAYRVVLTPAWAALAWRSYLPKLYAGRRPADFAAYLDTVVAALGRPGHARAFSRTARTTHAPVEARLGAVVAPTLVVMGECDPDFPDPRAEADWIARTLGAEVVMVPDAGHYPQSQQPELTTAAVLAFLARVG